MYFYVLVCLCVRVYVCLYVTVCLYVGLGDACGRRLSRRALDAGGSPRGASVFGLGIKGGEIARSLANPPPKLGPGTFLVLSGDPVPFVETSAALAGGPFPLWGQLGQPCHGASAAGSWTRMSAELVRIPFGDHPLTLERCREDYRGPCARMTRTNREV